MKEEITLAKNDGDSVGGVLETVVSGVVAGLGDPWFDSVEGLISHAMFSLGGVKGIEFGNGFELSKMRGSVANDQLFVENDTVKTKTNNNGGINGGITNGMPIVFSLAIKPTPTIFKEQDTVDFAKMENTTISPKGRHDPCIAHRARIVVDSLAAIALCDMLAGRYGTDWINE